MKYFLSLLVGLFLFGFALPSNAANVTATTVTNPDQYFVGSNFSLTVGITTETKATLGQYGEKCFMPVLVETIYRLNGLDDQYIHAVFPDDVPYGQLINNTTTWQFTNAPAINGTNWIFFTGDADTTCNTSLINDWTSYYTVNGTTLQNVDGTLFDNFIKSTEPLPSSTTSTTTSSSTIVISDDPTRNLFYGFMLFFITFFGLLFYSKKGGD